MESKYFKIVLLILFISFLALYFSSDVGLIDYQAKHRTALTEEQIKMFESDVANNKNIDLKKYIKDDNNHDNYLSKTTLKISNTIGESVESMLDFFMKKMNKAMNK